MNFFEKLKALLGIKIVSQDRLKNVCEKLQLDIGFLNVRERLTDSLNDIAKNADLKISFVLLGQQGLGKTIAARDVLTPFLYSIGRTQRDAFLKIKPYKLDKTDFSNRLNSKFIEGKGGVIFLDEVHNLRDVEAVFFENLINILHQDDYKTTAFVMSAGFNSWKKIKEKFTELASLFAIEIYFEPYTDEQLSLILQQIMHKDNDPIQIPKGYRLENLIRQLRAIRSRQRQYFENATEVTFYYEQCLKRAAISLQKDILDSDLEELSLKKFNSINVQR